MPTQPAPRRRFQFRLRTLMIGVTLLAVACAYVGWQAKIVTERKAMRERWSGKVWFRTPDMGSGSIPPTPPLPPTKVTWLRELFGDEALEEIWLPSDTPKSELDQIKALFPESTVEIETRPKGDP
jgi:hypothetical protein